MGCVVVGREAGGTEIVGREVVGREAGGTEIEGRGGSCSSSVRNSAGIQSAGGCWMGIRDDGFDTFGLGSSSPGM